MTKDIWGPLDPTKWRDVLHIAGRMAVEADVKEGRAVFYMKNCELFGGGPHAMRLPAPASWQNPEGGGFVDGVIIQAERGEGGKVLVGFRPYVGGNVLALLAEFTLHES